MSNSNTRIEPKLKLRSRRFDLVLIPPYTYRHADSVKVVGLKLFHLIRKRIEMFLLECASERITSFFSYEVQIKMCYAKRRQS